MSETKEAAPTIEAQPTVPPLTAEYRELKDRLKKEKSRFKYWDRMIHDPEMQEFIDDLNCKIETEILALEDVDKKELDQKQANIKAKRWMLSELRGLTSGANVNDAKAKLEQFEKANALFMDAIKAGREITPDAPIEGTENEPSAESADQPSGEPEEYIFDSLDKLLFAVVNSDAIDEAVCNGAKDAELLKAIVATLGDTEGGHSIPNKGSVEWKIKKGKPEFTFSVVGEDNKTHLAGVGVCERVRRYFTPSPAGAVAP